MTTDTKKDELEARIAELERAAKPPEPYITDWVVPPPAIDRVSMSPSTMREFAQAVPDNVIKDIVRDNRAPQGPSSAGASGQITRVSSNAGIIGSNTSGWINSPPLGPPPGIGLVDMIMEVDSAKQRGAAMVEEARRKAAEKSE